MATLDEETTAKKRRKKKLEKKEKVDCVTSSGRRRRCRGWCRHRSENLAFLTIAIRPSISSLEFSI